MKDKVKKFIIINAALLIMSFGLHFFLISANLAAGGVSGAAMVINHYIPTLEIGKSLLIADLLVVFAAIIAFGITKGLYAMLGIIINGMVIDRIIAGFGMKLKVIVISEFIVY